MGVRGNPARRVRRDRPTLRSPYPGASVCVWQVMHGAKRWLLYPERPPYFEENATSVSWLSQKYPLLAANELPFDCTILPGDLLYFPSGWWHAIINVGTPTVFMSVFL